MSGMLLERRQTRALLSKDRFGIKCYLRRFSSHQSLFGSRATVSLVMHARNAGFLSPACMFLIRLGLMEPGPSRARDQRYPGMALAFTGRFDCWRLINELVFPSSNSRNDRPICVALAEQDNGEYRRSRLRPEDGFSDCLATNAHAMLATIARPQTREIALHSFLPGDGNAGSYRCHVGFLRCILRAHWELSDRSRQRSRKTHTDNCPRTLGVQPSRDRLPKAVPIHAPVDTLESNDRGARPPPKRGRDAS